MAPSATNSTNPSLAHGPGRRAASGLSRNARLFGTLITTASRAANEYAYGVRVVHQELGWDQYETADGTFSSAYASAAVANLATMRAARMRVVLGTGIQYPPAWALALTNGKFVNQNGRNPSSGYNHVNTVFSQAMRNQVAAYYTRLNTDLGLNNYWAIDVGAAGDPEMLYPHANDGAGQTNSWWLYDTNAQSGGADLPAGITACPVASWVPGAGTVQNATDVWEWYIAALINEINWKISLLRDTLGYTGYLLLKAPGVAILPWFIEHILNDKLAGTVDTSQVSNRGAAWHLIANGITNKTKCVWHCSSAADDSGSPANNLSQASDRTVDIVNSLDVRDFSAMRWAQTLAWQYGYHSAGENPASGGGSYGPTMMDIFGQQARAGGYLVAMWAHDDDLDSGAQVTLTNYRNTINKYR